jgi:hypothetical protein
LEKLHFKKASNFFDFGISILGDCRDTPLKKLSVDKLRCTLSRLHHRLMLLQRGQAKGDRMSM